MLTKEECLKVLSVDDKVHKCQEHIKIFKKDTILLYIGRCIESKFMSAKGEKWMGMKDIFNRQFGYVLDTKLGLENIVDYVYKGDIAYADPHSGELIPIEEDNELLYFKVVKLDEINLLIK